MNDVVRMYNTTRTDGISFNLAYIGTEFNDVSPAPFDQGYMRKLFEMAMCKREKAALGQTSIHSPLITQGCVRRVKRTQRQIGEIAGP